MAERFPRITRTSRGQVKVITLPGETVHCPEDTKTVEELGLDSSHPNFEVFKHLFELLATVGKNLGDAADRGTFRDRLDAFDITLSSREEVR